jgi:transposase
MAKKGKLVLPALSEKPSLAALVVREDGRAAPELAQRWPLDLNCGAVTTRLDARTSALRIAKIAHA